MQPPKASLNDRRGLRAFRGRIIAAIILAFVAFIGVAVARAWRWIETPEPSRVGKAWENVERTAKEPAAPPSDATAYAAFLSAIHAAQPGIGRVDADGVAH